MKSALAKAQEIGLSGIQFSSLPDEVDVEKIDEQQAAEIVRLFADHGLEISSVCGDIGGFSIEDEALAKDRVERTKRILDVANLLGTKIVQSHIGHVPEDLSGKNVEVLRKSLEEIGRYAEEVGILFASETGPESGATLKSFLDQLAAPNIMVNYDPANLVMSGFDQIAGVYDLRDYIVHTHAKDGRPEPDEQGHLERPLGEGMVDFPRYIKALDEIGYNGYFVIEREVGENPAEHIARAKRFLDQF
jgi:sugar phosphate isomerase/epimerase